MTYEHLYLLAALLLLNAICCTANFDSRLYDPKILNLDPNLPSPFDKNSNGSTFLWLLEDTYAKDNFFNGFDFFTGQDPTNGRVNFLNADDAFLQKLAYVQEDGIVVMKGDNSTWLQDGQNRSSVRVSSKKLYNTGLFILDVNRAPWGCAVWPAFWTLGAGQWPLQGEIDIIEGVHANFHNQVTWHTSPDCNLTATADFTGTVVQSNGVNNTVCNGLINSNAGCGVTEWSQSSYGPLFDAQGGGVYAMKWDENGIAVWSFYRAAVPLDVQAGVPNPSTWGPPVAVLLPDSCDIGKNFVNHTIVFDITFCGDWAGNTYATSGCPGTCTDRLKDPSNFVNASWSINSLKVYRKQSIVLPSKAISNRISWLYVFGSLLLSGCIIEALI